ncbi:phosphodiester glycosidase family protein [Clostridium tertium]
MASNIKVDLETSKENYILTKCKQDDDLTLEAFIYENGLALDLTNKEIFIKALKADRTYINQSTGITKENNKVSAELIRDFSRVPGTTKIEILLVEGGKNNTTFSFYLEVEGSVIKGAVESSDKITILEELDNKVIEAVQVKQETENLIAVGGAATKGDIVNINSHLEQKININEDMYFDEINIEKKRDEVAGTTYWLTTIPHKDKIGNIIKLKTGVSSYYETNPNRHEDDGTGTDYNNNPKLETVRDFSIRKKATLVINGGTWGNQGANGNCVVNGEIKADVSAEYKRMPLGIKEDNTLKSYDYTVSASEEIADGCLDVVPGFYPIMIDGAKYSGSLQFDWEIKQPRTIIGQKSNKDIIIITANGRAVNENGLSMNDGVRLLLQYGCVFGYNLDGGGSTSLVYRNEFVNDKIDGNRKQERKLYSFIYIAKEENKDYKSKLFNEIIQTNISLGNLKSLIQDVVVDLFNKQDINGGIVKLKGEEGYIYQGIESWDGSNRNAKLLLHKDYLKYYDIINSRYLLTVENNGDISSLKGTLGMFNKTQATHSNLDTITESGLYWAIKTTEGSPKDISRGILHFQIVAIGAMQIAFPYSDDNETYKIKIRRRNASNDSWSEWKDF